MLNKKRLWMGGLTLLAIFYLAYTLFTGFPYSVNKSYEEAIYLGNQVVKRVPVKVSGEVYRGVFKTNQFTGDVEIDGKTYSISTFRNRRFFARTKHSYPYVGVVTVVDSQGFVATTGTIQISRNFGSVIASTDTITKKYGRGAQLRLQGVAQSSTGSGNQDSGFIKYEGSYVGNNSAVGNILSMLPGSGYVGKFSLQTGHKPYGITVYYQPSQSGVNNYNQFWNSKNPDRLLEKNAVVLFSLVQNADVITFHVQDVGQQTYTFTRTYVQRKYGDLSKLFHDESSYNQFLNQAN